MGGPQAGATRFPRAGPHLGAACREDAPRRPVVGAGTLGVHRWTLLGHCGSKEEGLFNVRGLLFPGLDWSLEIPEAAFQPPSLISQPGLTGRSPGSCPLHVPETLAAAKLRKAACTDTPHHMPPDSSLWRSPWGLLGSSGSSSVRSGPRSFCFPSSGAYPTHVP